MSRASLQPPRLRALRQAAEHARSANYAPYSGFLVLAAVETDHGVFGGSNIEIANFSLTKHAEEAALMAAIASGVGPDGAWLRSLYVVGGAPCGSCRQFAYEFSDAETLVVIDAVDQMRLRRASLHELAKRLPRPRILPLRDLFPEPFGREDLRKGR